jgi:SecD/SecF fusion protein
VRQQLGKVRVLQDNRIEVGVYGNDPTTLKKVTDIIEFTGKLEFRILANKHKHQEIIEIANNEPENTNYFDSKGKNWVARWVIVRQGETFGPMNLTRKRTAGDKTWTEVLVVNDFYNLTGDYLTKAMMGKDDHGQPCVLFSFNSKGGQLFGMLTGDNLPALGEPELKSQLGIILDGIVISAPNIQSTITDNGQITGNFTWEQVEQIVTCLNAGSLPANLRKVEERRVDSK